MSSLLQTPIFKQLVQNSKETDDFWQIAKKFGRKINFTVKVVAIAAKRTCMGRPPCRGVVEMILEKDFTPSEVCILTKLFFDNKTFVYYSLCLMHFYKDD